MFSRYARTGDRTTKNTLLFLGELIRSPQSVSAVAPSSKTLAALMTAELQGFSRPVIELGPGTGVFTQALLERGVPETRLGLVELNERFCERLRTAYPSAKVRQVKAEQLASVDFGFDTAPMAVVSGLPLLSFSPRCRYKVLSQAFSVLGQGAAFYQFTYGLTCPISDRILDRLNLKATRIGTALANVPPASVYRIKRKSD